MNDVKRDRGLATLTEIMGEEYVAARSKNANPFNERLHRFIEENCFGDTWQNEVLERKTRSLILISTLVALNRPAQVRAHVLSALNNGASVAEIEEVLYQTIAYCGLPAAADGFRIAEEVLRERGLL